LSARSDAAPFVAGLAARLLLFIEHDAWDTVTYVAVARAGPGAEGEAAESPASNDRGAGGART
jgi:hypothetical protein